MSDSSSHPISSEALSILEAAAVRPSVPPGGVYAGSVTPQEAWRLHTLGAAKIVDVRTEEEREYVGRVPDTVHVPWRLRGAQEANPRFLEQLRAVAAQDEAVLLLCRSAHRSHLAADVAAAAGFRAVFNILEGFEGAIDEHFHRGGLGGWRKHGLPWVQG